MREHLEGQRTTDMKVKDCMKTNGAMKEDEFHVLKKHLCFKESPKCLLGKNNIDIPHFDSYNCKNKIYAKS